MGDLDDRGQVRKGWVADVTRLLETHACSTTMQVIVRKQPPHPGAKQRFTDIDGRRFTAFAAVTERRQLTD